MPDIDTSTVPALNIGSVSEFPGLIRAFLGAPGTGSIFTADTVNMPEDICHTRGLCACAGSTAPDSPELQALLTAVTKEHPGRVAGAQALIGGLRRLTLVAAEEWLAVLHAAILEMRRRLVTLKVEAVRIRAVAAGDEASRVVLWQRRYTTLLHNVTSNLKALLQVRFILLLCCFV